jgi:hypothetical protein
LAAAVAIVEAFDADALIAVRVGPVAFTIIISSANNAHAELPVTRQVLALLRAAIVVAVAGFGAVLIESVTPFTEAALKIIDALDAAFVLEIADVGIPCQIAVFRGATRDAEVERRARGANGLFVVWATTFTKAGRIGAEAPAHAAHAAAAGFAAAATGFAAAARACSARNARNACISAVPCAT